MVLRMCATIPWPRQPRGKRGQESRLRCQRQEDAALVGRLQEQPSMAIRYRTP